MSTRAKRYASDAAAAAAERQARTERARAFILKSDAEDISALLSVIKDGLLDREAEETINFSAHCLTFNGFFSEIADNVRRGCI